MFRVRKGESAGQLLLQRPTDPATSLATEQLWEVWLHRSAPLQRSKTTRCVSRTHSLLQCLNESIRSRDGCQHGASSRQ